MEYWKVINIVLKVVEILKKRIILYCLWIEIHLDKDKYTFL